MPRKYIRRKQVAAEIAKATPDKPVYVPLALPERTKLLALFNDPIFRQAWANAQLYKPSAFAGGMNTALGPQLASNRLHQLQGWMLFEAALLRQVEDPKIARKTVEENYPDSGMPGAKP